MQVQLCHIDGLNAIPLIGAYEKPACLDLTCTRIIKVQDGVAYLGTGWSVCPPSGYYVEIHPRSSMVKKGWMLANSTGIIDPDYTGELIVALTPTIRFIMQGYKDMDEYLNDTLRLPEALVQICLRSYIPIDVCEVPFLIPTSRGSGAYGSSNTKQD